MTSLIAGFVCKLHSSLTNTVFLKQLVQIGFLAHFESLLSTNGEENFSSLFCLNADDVECGPKPRNTRLNQELLVCLVVKA